MAKTSREWSELYNKFEGMYNPYPVQMSRAEAFGKARNDGLITDEEYYNIKKMSDTEYCEYMEKNLKEYNKE